MATLDLSTSFPPVSDDAWKAKLEQDLKGKPFERLIWKTEEGIPLQPYYRRLPEAGMSFPSDSFPTHFHSIQAIPVDDPAAAKRLIEQARAAEVRAFRLYAYRPDLPLAAFEDVVARLTEEDEVHVDLPVGIWEAAPEGVLASSLAGLRLVADPISRAAARHEACDQAQLQALRPWLLDQQQPARWGLDFRYVAEQGGHKVQELGLALATLVEYIDQLKLPGEGQSWSQLDQSLSITFSVGSNFYMELAKFRAMRMLLHRLWTVYAPEHAPTPTAFLIAESSQWEQTRYDVYTNLLRNTSSAMAALLGGADGLVVLGHDHILKPEHEFSSRLARNIQHLFRHESHLGLVDDPARGSYFFEHLSQQLAEKAWGFFQEIEQAGGMLECLVKGKVSDWLAQAREAQLTRVAKRKKVAVGVNQYPNPLEAMEGELDLSQPTFAREFEALRYRADQLGRQRGRRLTAFLYAYGQVVWRNARTNFSRNLLGSGGFAIAENSHPDDAALSLKELKGQQPDVVVICASDDDYLSSGKERIAALKEAYPAATYVLAGRPEGEWPVFASIYAGMNAVEFLQQLQAELPIPSQAS